MPAAVPQLFHLKAFSRAEELSQSSQSRLKVQGCQPLTATLSKQEMLPVLRRDDSEAHLHNFLELHGTDPWAHYCSQLSDTPLIGFSLLLCITLFNISFQLLGITFKK